MTLADSRKARLLVMHHASETSDFFLFTNDQLTTPTTPLTIPKKDYCYFTIVGHCHGLLCLFNYNSELCLWNPATREIKYIPWSPIPPPPTFHGDEDAEFGFGFDWKTRDYKVVKLLRNYYDVENRNNYGYQVEVYNLSTNSWREIDVNVPFHGHERRSPTAYMNGTYYWWAWRAGKEEEEGRSIGVIICFDMSNEQFGTIHLPKMDFPLNEVKILELCFTEYDGLLAVIFYVEHENNTWSELWTMDGHGMAVTWTKQFSVGWLEGMLRPIGSCKNNRILFVNGWNFIIPYDHKTKSVQIAIPIDPEKRMGHRCGATTVAFYTESLVFPGWK